MAKSKYKFYLEPNGDYLGIIDKGGKVTNYSGKATTIQGEPGSITDTTIGADHISKCKEVKKKDVPTKWVKEIEKETTEQ